MITEITTKLQRLLDGYLDQDIDKEVYRLEKSKLLSEKKSLEEEISRNQQKQKHWLVSWYQRDRNRSNINTGEPAKLVLGSRFSQDAHRSSVWYSPVYSALHSRLGTVPIGAPDN